jgi:hypothetical protein
MKSRMFCALMIGISLLLMHTSASAANLYSPLPAAKLTAHGAGSLGETVSISGDTIVAGARVDSRDVDLGGAAYVFVRTPNGWIEQQRLAPADIAAGDQFGSSVAISGDTIVVGAMNDDDGANNAGSAYVFVRSGTTWTLQQKLRAADPGADHAFGLSVAIEGNTVVVGSPLDGHAGLYSGSAYVFVGSGTAWAQQQKLTGSDTVAVDRFGFSVAINNETIAIGGPTLGSGEGQAYVFARNGSIWIEQQKLTSTDGGPGAMFGVSVRVDRETIAIGSRGRLSSGAIYLFERDPSGWIQQQIVTASGSGFGSSIAINGETLVGGAPGSAACIFTRHGNLWSQQQTLTSGNPPSVNQFGYSSAISDYGWIAISDPSEGSYSGGVYVFEPDNEPPVITSVRADPSILWPPNHKFVPVTLTVTATDNAGVTRCRITSVESNEPSKRDDWEITDDLTLRLRAERLSNGVGRIYTIAIQCQDGAGNIAQGLAVVRVAAR